MSKCNLHLKYPKPTPEKQKESFFSTPKMNHPVVPTLIFLILRSDLSKELLLITLHVNVTFELGTSSADLEAKSAVGSTGVQLLQTAHTAVLHGVFEASSKVRDKLVDGSI